MPNRLLLGGQFGILLLPLFWTNYNGSKLKIQENKNLQRRSDLWL